MFRPLVLLFLLLLPAGCALFTDPGSDSRAESLAQDGELLQVERAEYSRGEVVRVRLVNRLDQPIGHNLCLSAREIREGSEWRRIEPLRSCVAALFNLEVGEETLHEEMTDDWEPGTYRIVTSVELMEDGERLEIFSGSFQLRP